MVSLPISKRVGSFGLLEKFNTKNERVSEVLIRFIVKVTEVLKTACGVMFYNRQILYFNITDFSIPFFSFLFELIAITGHG